MLNRLISRPVGRACAFVGPSLAGRRLPPDIDAFPPATRGAVSAAVRAGYTRIGLIDGLIEEDERLPLQELTEALATRGVTVFGGGSMGAVRAAQFESEGMHGVGCVFRLFRRGSLTDSDEVHVLHAPAELQYRCLTTPLVNIRYTLRAMRRGGRVSGAEEDALVNFMRDVPWFDRDRQSLSAAIYATCGRSSSALIMHAFDSMYCDVKQKDAWSLVSKLQYRARSKATEALHV